MASLQRIGIVLGCVNWTKGKEKKIKNHTLQWRERAQCRAHVQTKKID